MNESEVFAGALKTSSPEELDSFLSRACEGNLTLRTAVEELLKAHNDAPEFLEDDPGLFDRIMHPTGHPSDPVVANSKDELSFLMSPGRADSLGRLGHYEILDVIGRGGMGIVLRALDEKLQRVVAIKVMASALAADPTSRNRFLREARAAAAVSHDHVVTIHAVEEMGDRPYLVMNLVAGQSLEQRIKRSGSLQLHEILRIGMQIAAGLAAAHAQGIVHRDIKPANILLENSVERVKITDFGLARAASDPSLTHHGTMTGTPSYMAPEQVKGEPLDHRADLFSLGSVIYAMCTGRAPFRGTDTLAVLKRVCDESPEPIQELNPDVPGWLCDIVGKLQSKRPQDRFQTASEVAELLARHLGHQQERQRTSERTSSSPASRNGLTDEASRERPARLMSAALSASLALIIVLSGVVVWQSRDREATGVVHRGEVRGSELAAGKSPLRTPASSGNLPPEPAEPAAASAASAQLAQATADDKKKGEVTSVPANFALEFNGKTDYVELGDLTFDGSHPLTLECWATPLGEDRHMQRFVVSNGNYVEKRETGFSLYERGNKYPNPEFTSWAFGYSDKTGGRGSLAASPQSWRIGKAAHVAATIDGTKWRFYTDGALWRHGQLGGDPSRSEKPFFIGRHPTLQGYYSGIIDEVRISRTVRYQDNFVPARRFSPDDETLALYHFDQGEGNMLHDSSGNGRHGTIVGASWVRVKD